MPFTDAVAEQPPLSPYEWLANATPFETYGFPTLDVAVHEAARD
ncbi:hypothetical protein [Cryobacterium psychrophilum]|nr:hypothetical protein [Cryobacterium psychrophilum]